MIEREAEPRQLEVLTKEKCFDLLRAQVIGRIAVASPDGPPLVVPVTFVLDGTDVIFRSDPGQKLGSAGEPVSFQVDAFDHVHRTGWSVLVQGRIELPGDDELAHVSIEPWIGARRHWVRIVPDVITGRRLVLELPEVDERGYR